MGNTVFNRYIEDVDGLTPTPSLDWKNESVKRRTLYGVNLNITHEIFDQLMNRLQGKKDWRYNKIK